MDPKDKLVTKSYLKKKLTPLYQHKYYMKKRGATLKARKKVQEQLGKLTFVFNRIKHLSQVRVRKDGNRNLLIKLNQTERNRLLSLLQLKGKQISALKKLIAKGAN